METAKTGTRARFDHVRNWFANKLGVREEQKEEIYIQISKSASLRDVSYWIQVLFSAGIATLGLVLNSPAVIIGAMLISPLMGPILASGLTLATGDMVLGVRALTNLMLSCMLAIFFAMLVVGLLPFKEVTGEIAARTQPNTLDLFIALFSGAVGSIAICKEVKGVVTSIPGVAIAVALMPPLCVTGFGLGVAITINDVEGMRVARGGGLLFLTNLVAITFTAMVVFVALHIDTKRVKESVRKWRSQDKESMRVREALLRMPASRQLRRLDSLPGRFVLIFMTILVILVPLSQSFSQLKQEIARKQDENRIKRTATEVWENNFSRLPTGEPRCYLGQVSLLDREGKLALLLRVFTSKPYTGDEKAEYRQLLASRLGRPVQSIALQLIEIPTTTSDILTRAREPEITKKEEPPAPLTLAQLQDNFSHEVENMFREMRLPPPAQLVDYAVKVKEGEPLQVELVYLSERAIDGDAQVLLVDDLRKRLDNPNAQVSLERIEASPVELKYDRNQSVLQDEGITMLDRIAPLLQKYPKLRLEISAGADNKERDRIAEERAEAIREQMFTKFQISRERMQVMQGKQTGRSALLNIKLSEQNAER